MKYTPSVDEVRFSHKQFRLVPTAHGHLQGIRVMMKQRGCWPDIMFVSPCSLYKNVVQNITIYMQKKH